MSIAKIIVLAILMLILLSLGAGMFSLIKDRNQTNRTAKFLTLRIALSILLFALLVVSFFMGWIQPHGIVPTQS
jgi:succinate dehydrogenase hydrophobic anchor subunit